MRILDRYIIRNFLINYLLALIVLMGMVVLLDLIVNFDRFIKGAKAANEAGAVHLWVDIADYYGYQCLVIFQVIAGVIPLLAAGFTMVRMTRHRELTAMLASGVSLYRVAAPIVLLAIGLSLLAVMDQEILIPRFQDQLLRKHEEVNLSVAPSSGFEMLRDHQNLVTFMSYDRTARTLHEVRIIWRDDRGRVFRREMADEATWVPGSDNVAGDMGVPAGIGYWLMKGNARYIDDRVAGMPSTTGPAVSGGASVVPEFPYSTGLEPKHVELFLSKRAIDFLGSGQINELIRNSPPVTRPALEKIMHTRATQPVMNVIMLLLGIPFLLTREPNRLIKNMFTCTVVSGVCFAGTFVFYHMGGNLMPPILSAWMPVLLFGPISLAMLDAIKT
jgi:lipopolysaccharide export system permease protein